MGVERLPFLFMKKHLTGPEVRLIRIKESEKSFEKYVKKPFRTFCWFIFWIIVYFLIFG
jgi:hypothetical protein